MGIEFLPPHLTVWNEFILQHGHHLPPQVQPVFPNLNVRQLGLLQSHSQIRKSVVTAVNLDTISITPLENPWAHLHTLRAILVAKNDNTDRINIGLLRFSPHSCLIHQYETNGPFTMLPRTSSLLLLIPAPHHVFIRLHNASEKLLHLEIPPTSPLIPNMQYFPTSLRSKLSITRLKLYWSLLPVTFVDRSRFAFARLTETSIPL